MFLGHHVEKWKVINLKMGNNTFANVHTAVSIANGTNANIEFDGNLLINCVKGIEERDPPSLLESLGLPRDTPPNLVLEVLRELRAKPGASTVEQQEIVKKSKLWPFAEKAANVTTVLQGLAALAGSAFSIPTAF